MLAGAGAGDSDVTKYMRNVKFPWIGEDGKSDDKPSDEEIIAAGGDPENEFWWIETGDLSAVDKNAGKSIETAFR